MLVFRSFALGLLGACFWILATRPVAVILRPPPMPTFEIPNLSGMRGVPENAPPTLVDIAPGVAAAQLPSLIQLREGEHVRAVNDTRVASDLEAGRLLATVGVYPQRYIDLDVSGPSGERRLLVLLH